MSKYCQDNHSSQNQRSNQPSKEKINNIQKQQNEQNEYLQKQKSHRSNDSLNQVLCYLSKDQQTKTSPQYLFQYLDYFYNKQFEQIKNNFQKIISQKSREMKFSQSSKNVNIKLQKNNIFENQYFTKILQKLNTLKKHKIQQLQNQILQNGQFKKHPQFTEKLKILNIRHSRHYEVINIELHLLSYTLKIEILNRTKQSIIHKKHFGFQSGNFGDVYFVDHQDSDYAIKCISFNPKYQVSNISNFQLIKLFKQTLKQYFLLKLFQTLKIGPKLKQIYGFDMIMFSSCFQFSMEVCSKTDMTKSLASQLKQKLQIMHLLNIVHRDIKPSNAMYSHYFQSFVFIDFGGAEVISQQIGFKSVSTFFGTCGYFGQQMKSILRQGKGVIDLYHNDLFGWKKLLKQIQIKENSYQIYFQRYLSQIDFKQNIFETDESFYTFQLIHALHTKKYKQFLTKWKFLQNSNIIGFSNYKQQVVSFFTELESNEQLRKILFLIINIEFLDIRQKEIFLFYKKNIIWQILDLVTFPQKQKQFSMIYSFYESILILQTNESDRYKIMKIVLLNKKNTEQFIFLNHIPYESIQIQNINQITIKQDLMLYTFVFLKFCTFSQNLFNATIDQKIKAVEQYKNFILKTNQFDLKDFELIFVCQIPQLKKIAEFFQFIALYIWSQLPLTLKGPALSMIIISLILLGYPFKILKAKLYLQDIFISCDQPRYQRIIYFWQFNLSMISYGKIYFKERHDNFLLQISQQSTNQSMMRQKQLITEDKQFQWKSSQSQQIDFYSLNQQIYLDGYLNYRFSDGTKYLSLSQNLKQIQKTNTIIPQSLFKQWKYYIQLIVSMVYDLQNDFYRCKNKITSQIWEGDRKLKSLTLFKLTYTLSYNQAQVLEILDYFIQYFQTIVNCEQVSNRFCINERISLAYKKQNWSTFRKLLGLMLSQMKQYSFTNLQYLFCSSKIMKQLIIYFNDYLKANERESFIDFDLFFKLIEKIYRFFIYYNEQCLQYITIESNNSNYLDSYEQHILQQKTQNLSHHTYLNLDPQRNLKRTIIEREIFIFSLIRTLKNLQISCKIMESIVILLSQKHKSIYSKYLLDQYVQKIKSEPTLQNVFQIQKQQCYENDSRQIEDYLCNYLENVEEQSKIYIKQIKQSKQFKYLVKNSDSAKNNFVQFEISQYESIDIKNQNIITFIQSIYGKLKPQYYRSKNPLKLPDQQNSFNYFVSKIQLSKHSNQDYENLIQFYKSTKDMKNYEQFWVKSHNTTLVYNALLYCNKPQEQFRDFFQYIARLLKEHPTKFYLKTFYLSFQIRLWCQCSICFPKPLNCKNKLFDIVFYLSNNLQTKVTRQNCYMSLIYICCLQNQSVQVKQFEKMLAFVRYSIQYVSNYGKKKILQNIYELSLRLLVKSIHKYNIQKYNRKILYLVKHSLRYLNKKMSTQKIIQLRLQNQQIRLKDFQNLRFIILKQKLVKFYQAQRKYEPNK